MSIPTANKQPWGQPWANLEAMPMGPATRQMTMLLGNATGQCCDVLVDRIWQRIVCIAVSPT